MIRKSFMGLAVAAAACVGLFGTPSKAEAHGRYYRSYPAHRSYYYSAPVVYSRPVYYSTPVVYSPPVVYTSPVVYSRPVYYTRPTYYGPSHFSFGYWGGHRHHHGGVSVRVGF
jgi:hypothetical protein